MDWIAKEEFRITQLTRQGSNSIISRTTSKQPTKTNSIKKPKSFLSQLSKNHPSKPPPSSSYLTRSTDSSLLLSRTPLRDSRPPSSWSGDRPSSRDARHEQSWDGSAWGGSVAGGSVSGGFLISQKRRLEELKLRRRDLETSRQEKQAYLEYLKIVFARTINGKPPSPYSSVPHRQANQSVANQSTNTHHKSRIPTHTNITPSAQQQLVPSQSSSAQPLKPHSLQQSLSMSNNDRPPRAPLLKQIDPLSVDSSLIKENIEPKPFETFSQYAKKPNSTHRQLQTDQSLPTRPQKSSGIPHTGSVTGSARNHTHHDSRTNFQVSWTELCSQEKLIEKSLK